MFDPNSDYTAIIDAVKQLGFYTDCLGEANWSEPDAVVDEEFAQSIVRVADLLTPKKSITPREVELWMIHVGPQIGSANMAEGAVRFYDAMQSEGLDDNDPEYVRKFFGIRHENN